MQFVDWTLEGVHWLLAPWVYFFWAFFLSFF